MIYEIAYNMGMQSHISPDLMCLFLCCISVFSLCVVMFVLVNFYAATYYSVTYLAFYVIIDMPLYNTLRLCGTDNVNVFILLW